MQVIAGVITDAAGPCARLVRLSLTGTGAFVAELTSDATTGEYSFGSLLAGTLYDVVAFDPDYADGGGKVVASVVPFNDAGELGAHLYWRIKNIGVTGGLEISELQVLSAGTNVTATATKTSSDAPASWATLAQLFDGDLYTRVYWDQPTATASGFFIKFAFASPTLIDGVKQGTWDHADRTMAGFDLEFSDDDSTWTRLDTKVGLVYPGDFTLSGLYSFLPPPDPHRYWRLDNFILGETLLDLGEFRVFHGATDVTDAATYSSARPLDAGTFAAWTDNDDTNRGFWNGTVATMVLDIDLGTSGNIDGVKLTAYVTTGRFPSAIDVSYSDDGTTYTYLGTISGMTYPGDHTRSPLYSLP